MVLWTQELAARISPSKVLVASVSPGLCRTGLFRDVNASIFSGLVEQMFYRTAEQGACQYFRAKELLDASTHGFFFSDGKARPYVF